LFEIGTQGNDVAIVDGGPGTPTLKVVLAGTRLAIWVSSNGTNLVNPIFMPLGEEPAV